MKPSILLAVFVSALALAACDSKESSTVMPAQTAPESSVAPAPGMPGTAGDTGANGTTGSTGAAGDAAPATTITPPAEQRQ
jgi:hypothetical protein